MFSEVHGSVPIKRYKMLGNAIKEASGSISSGRLKILKGKLKRYLTFRRPHVIIVDEKDNVVETSWNIFYILKHRNAK